MGEYRGSLTREQFLFYETRVVAKLMLEGKDEKEIYKEIIDDNLFQMPTEKSIMTIAKGVYNRLNSAGTDKLINVIANEPSEVAKQAALYLLMRYNQLVWDFMVDVIGEKYSSKDYSLEPGEVNAFLSHLQANNEKVATWSDATMNKIRSVLINCLAEDGHLNNVRSKQLNYVYLYDEVLDCINTNDDRAVLKAFNYFM